jgi:hypothetical protein
MSLAMGRASKTHLWLLAAFLIVFVKCETLNLLEKYQNHGKL